MRVLGNAMFLEESHKLLRMCDSCLGVEGCLRRSLGMNAPSYVRNDILCEQDGLDLARGSVFENVQHIRARRTKTSTT